MSGSAFLERELKNIGWLPNLEVVVVANGVFIRLVGWTGSFGSAPTNYVGWYMGTNGWVETTEAAYNWAQTIDFQSGGASAEDLAALLATAEQFAAGATDKAATPAQILAYLTTQLAGKFGQAEGEALTGRVGELEQHRDFFTQTVAEDDSVSFASITGHSYPTVTVDTALRSRLVAIGGSARVTVSFDVATTDGGTRQWGLELLSGGAAVSFEGGGDELLVSDGGASGTYHLSGTLATLPASFVPRIFIRTGGVGGVAVSNFVMKIEIEANSYLIATQAQAEAGTDNEALMTPLRAEQHGNANYRRQDTQIVEADIVDNAITETKIAPDSVTQAHFESWDKGVFGATGFSYLLSANTGGIDLVQDDVTKLPAPYFGGVTEATVPVRAVDGGIKMPVGVVAGITYTTDRQGNPLVLNVNEGMVAVCRFEGHETYGAILVIGDRDGTTNERHDGLVLAVNANNKLQIWIPDGAGSGTWVTSSDQDWQIQSTRLCVGWIQVWRLPDSGGIPRYNVRWGGWQGSNVVNGAFVLNSAHFRFIAERPEVMCGADRLHNSSTTAHNDEVHDFVAAKINTERANFVGYNGEYHYVGNLKERKIETANYTSVKTYWMRNTDDYLTYNTESVLYDTIPSSSNLKTPRGFGLSRPITVNGGFSEIITYDTPPAHSDFTGNGYSTDAVWWEGTEEGAVLDLEIELCFAARTSVVGGIFEVYKVNPGGDDFHLRASVYQYEQVSGTVPGLASNFTGGVTQGERKKIDLSPGNIYYVIYWIQTGATSYTDRRFGGNMTFNIRSS